MPVKPVSDFDSQYVEDLEQKAEAATTAEDYRAAMKAIADYKGEFITAGDDDRHGEHEEPEPPREGVNLSNYVEAEHPRDDHGHWVDKGDLKAAATDPAKAAALRSRVTDPAQRKKLDAIIGGEDSRSQPHTRAGDVTDRKNLGGEAKPAKTVTPKLAKGQQLTDAIFEAVKSDPDTAAAKISDMVRDVAYEVADVKAHSMTKPVKVKKVSFNGVDFLVQSSLLGKKGEESAIGHALLNLAAARFPPELHKLNRRVVLTNQANADDGYWESKFGVSGFKAAATGGDGDVVVYGVKAGSHSLDTGIYVHETGHNLAHAIWNSQTPPADSEYAKAAAEEPPVSDYGKHSPAEDFAEAVREYFNGGTYLEKVYPKKYAAVKNIMTKLREGNGDADS